jgi:hypothetical protein
MIHKPVAKNIKTLFKLQAVARLCSSQSHTNEDLKINMHLTL